MCGLASLAPKVLQKCTLATNYCQTQTNLCFVSQALSNQGTVTASPNFNPSEDVAVLDKAIKAKGEVTMNTWSVCEHAVSSESTQF